MNKHLTPLKRIRLKCLDCCAGSAHEVRNCPCGPDAPDPCPLYPLRLGRNPARAGKGGPGNTEALARYRTGVAS